MPVTVNAVVPSVQVKSQGGVPVRLKLNCAVLPSHMVWLPDIVAVEGGCQEIVLPLPICVVQPSVTM